jgi:hypothetical protein
MNLTMGGVADMMGLSYACLIASGAMDVDYSFIDEHINPAFSQDLTISDTRDQVILDQLKN